MMKKHYLACGLFLALISLAPSKNLGGTPVPGEGAWWLKSSGDVRQSYSAAYILGFKKGYGAGCLKGTEVLPPTPGKGPQDNPRHICLQQGPHFPESTASIARQITVFYERYPNDRDIYIQEIIASLGAGETLNQIHQRHHSAIAK
jgi:hypothetical protein